MEDEPLLPDDRPLRSRSDDDQPTRAEAKVGLTIAVVLLALYGLWIWSPWQGDGSGGSACETVSSSRDAALVDCG